MQVKRIVPNIATGEIDEAKRFYRDFLGMDVVMDHGWIVTFAGEGAAVPQLSVGSQGGSGTAVPDFSIEVDDLEEAYLKALAANLAIEYGPALEPWGVRRFFVRDPFGKLLNILGHDRPDAGQPKE